MLHLKYASLAVAVTLWALIGTAHAAGTKEAPKQIDLTAVKAKIEAKDFAGAIADLTPLAAKGDNADVLNLMGYANRKSGDLKQAASWYEKALAMMPEHKGALEYQGEMFLMMKDVDKAKANLAKLAALCPSGCEEKEDLEKEINAYASGATTN